MTEESITYQLELPMPEEPPMEPPVPQNYAPAEESAGEQNPNSHDQPAEIPNVEPGNHHQESLSEVKVDHNHTTTMADENSGEKRGVDAMNASAIAHVGEVGSTPNDDAAPKTGMPDSGLGMVLGTVNTTRHAPPPKKRRTGTKRSATRPWNDMLFELLKYRMMHGNVMVPFKSGGELGKWVANQRAQYVGLQKSIMKDDSVAKTKWLSSEGTERLTEERMKVLTSVGFVWDVVQADNDARWKKRFEELLEYKAIHGHCNVPQSTDLGKWVKMQRENKHEADLKKAGTTPHRKKPKPCLSEDRIRKLEGIGFQWRVAKPAVGWDKRFQQLEDYKRDHGDCNVPQSFPPDKPFGRWVMKQRCQHSLKLRGEKSQLTDERERKLNDIGFSWVAPGFSKKTVSMPDDDDEDAVAAHMQALVQAQVHGLPHPHGVHQDAAVAAAHDMVAPHHHHHHHHQEEYATWNV